MLWSDEGKVKTSLQFSSVLVEGKNSGRRYGHANVNRFASQGRWLNNFLTGQSPAR